MPGWATYLEMELHEFIHKTGSRLYIETKNCCNIQSAIKIRYKESFKTPEM